MNDELRKRMNAIPDEMPDAIDTAMLNEAAKVNDGSTVSLEEFQESLEGYNGRILLRIPRSLHKHLAESARIEGVSLNQYALYKLSRD